MLPTPAIDAELRLTAAQERELVASYQLAYATLVTLYAQALALHDTLVPAGTLNERGEPVPGRANSLVRRNVEALVAGAQALAALLPGSLHDLVRYEHRYVAQGFVSAAEMDGHYASLRAEIPRLRAQFGLSAL